MRNIGTGILLAFALSSCGGLDRPALLPPVDRSNEIHLTVMTPDTKAEITENNIANIVLYGFEDNFQLWENPYPQGDSLVVTRPADNGAIWRPVPPRKWKNTSTYSFHAYTYDFPQAASQNGGSLRIGGKGKSINVVQPNTYSVDQNGHNTIDYLLSYHVIYLPSPAHPLVPIKLEHAMSKISLYMEKSPKIDPQFLKNIKVEFRNIIRDSKMICSVHKEIKDNNVKQNIWVNTLGNQTATYTHGISSDNVKQEGESTGPVMSFIGVPVDNTAMKAKNYQLHISYQIETPGTPLRSYERTFNLADLRLDWLSGHNIRYKFLIDNDVKLTGSIQDWIDVDYIEGTILPPINDDGTLN